MDTIALVVNGTHYTCTPTEPAPEVPAGVPWSIDLTDKVARRSDLPAWPNGRWPVRRLSDLTHITVHHINGLADPIALSRGYLYKGSGRPAPPYSLWIERDGTVKKLLYLDEANWHDHSGSGNAHHWSIGLNGTLHKYPPTQAQYDSLVRVCVWAIRNPEMNIARERITGHMDWTSTACPGWRSAASGYWKARFLAQLDEALRC